MASSVRPASTAATPSAYQASESPGNRFTARHCLAFHKFIRSNRHRSSALPIKREHRVSGISQCALSAYWEIHGSPEIRADPEVSDAGQVIRAPSDVEPNRDE